mgnify:FL=1
MSYTRRAVLLGGFTSLISSQLTQVAQAASPDISHGPRGGKEVALTFHGAGDLEIATKLLNIFKSTSTPVTIFAVGTFLKQNPEFAKQIIDGGHDLGNHTMTHTQMKTLSANRVDAEIAGCANLLKKLIGNHGAFFRPSGTQYSTGLIRRTAQKYGYKNCISYDVDSHDYQDPGAKAVIRNVNNGVKAGSIISLHFGHANTVKAMPKIIDDLKNKGLTPVTITKLLGKI